MKKNKKALLLSILGIIGLIVITAGVTYAFFNYAKEGTTENSVTTGTITFLYTEVSEVGRGISLSDAYPMSDEVGKVQTGEGNVFDFKVTSNTMNEASISYEVTARKKDTSTLDEEAARKKDTSTLDEEAVKLYLTKVSGTAEEEVLLDNYSNLTQTTKVSADKYTEKTIYTGKVPAGSTNYEQAFRLRMWIDEDTDFSPNEDGTYPYNGKTFTITVNVYANAKVVTEEDITLASNANISSLSVAGEELTFVTEQDYDYETSLPEGTTSTTINVETDSEYAIVNIEKLDSLAYTNTSNVKRLSASKNVELTSGDNYFKITVTSENKQVENEFILKISVGNSGTLLSDAIFNKYTTIYENPTLTASSNNTTDESGLYKSTATNFNGVEGTPTYYFRGSVENNYIDFAGFTWRIVRINEDGTIRIVMQDGINDNANLAFNSNYNNKNYMYYTNNSNAKTQLETWYNTNIASNENYSNRVATGDYYCEQAKVAYSSSYATNSGADMIVYSSYTNPNFKCEKDANGYGIVNASVGLLSYDEVLHAGGYYNKSNSNYYLYNSAIYWWTMSPAGFSGSHADGWRVSTSGVIDYINVTYTYRLRAVLNLKADTTVTGLGTSDSHWAVAN